MSQTQPHRVHNLRTRAESAAERSEPATVDMSLMNIELCNNICDKFAEALRVELNSSLANVVNSFKEDIVDELRKRDHEILALKSDNINLRENLNSACDKILEANIIDISNQDFKRFVHILPAPRTSERTSERTFVGHSSRWRFCCQTFEAPRFSGGK